MKHKLKFDQSDHLDWQTLSSGAYAYFKYSSGCTCHLSFVIGHFLVFESWWMQLCSGATDGGSQTQSRVS